jgi:hypothetical protein
MVDRTRETTNTMATTSRSFGGLRQARVAAGGAAVCVCLVLGLSLTAGAASAPTGRRHQRDDHGSTEHDRPDRGELDPDHDVHGDRNRDDR